jgi:hypothetical protein
VVLSAHNQKMRPYGASGLNLPDCSFQTGRGLVSNWRFDPKCDRTCRTATLRRACSLRPISFIRISASHCAASGPFNATSSPAGTWTYCNISLARPPNQQAAVTIATAKPIAMSYWLNCVQPYTNVRSSCVTSICISSCIQDLRPSWISLSIASCWALGLQKGIDYQPILRLGRGSIDGCDGSHRITCSRQPNRVLLRRRTPERYRIEPRLKSAR